MGKPRYIPPLKWSDRSVLYNLFRIYEQIFGRRFGIRPEASTALSLRKGQRIVRRKFYTLEAFVVFVEQEIFQFFRNFEIVPVRLPVLQFSDIPGEGIQLFPNVFFAIGYDTASHNVAGADTSVTVSHTITGSNTFLTTANSIYKASGGSTNYLSSVTYATVAETQHSAGQIVIVANVSDYFHYLVNPTTGANNCVMTATTTVDELDMVNTSYSGAAQTGQPDASNSSGPTAGQTSLTLTVTTVANNCWLIGFFHNRVGAWTAGANTTWRDSFNGSADNSGVMMDSNSAQTPAGSKSLTATCSSSTVSGFIISIAPYVAASSSAEVVNTLTLLGVG